MFFRKKRRLIEFMKGMDEFTNKLKRMVKFAKQIQQASSRESFSRLCDLH